MKSKDNVDTFEKEVRTDKTGTLEIVHGIFGAIAGVCGLYYLKDPKSAKEYLFGEKENNENEVDKRNPVE